MCRWNRERWYWTGAVGLGCVPILAVFRLAVFLFWNAADAWSQLGFRGCPRPSARRCSGDTELVFFLGGTLAVTLLALCLAVPGGVLRIGLSRPALGGKSARGDEREITTMIERNAHFSFAILPGDQSVRGRAGDRSAHREPRPETNGLIRANCRGEVERSSRAVEGFRACQRTPLPAAKQNAARKLSRCRRTAR